MIEKPNLLRWGHMFCTWSAWEQYEHITNSIYEGKQVRLTERRQRRHCTQCNKEQDEWVRAG